MIHVWRWRICGFGQVLMTTWSSVRVGVRIDKLISYYNVAAGECEIAYNMSLSRFKLVFFAPADSTRRILDHLFRTFPDELGKIGEYEQCAFITRGTGQRASI